MLALFVLAFVFVRQLRLSLDVLSVLVGGWVLLLWLTTAAPTGPQLATVLGVVTLVVTMVYLEFYQKRR